MKDKKMSFKYSVKGVAELGKVVDVKLDAGPSGETVSTALFEFSEVITMDQFIQKEDYNLVRDKVETPYQGYFFGNKEQDLVVKYLGRFVPDEPQEEPIKD